MCFLLFYLLSYTVLSIFGTYVPLAWGASYVKWYRWAPAGFASGLAGMEYTGKNKALTLFYYLLLLADNKWIHTHDRAESGKWPVNRTLNEALRKATEEFNRKHRPPAD